MKTMTCERCVHSLTEKEIENLKDEGEGNKIKSQWGKEKAFIMKYLREGEEPIFCCWSYTIMGCQSVCADVEIPDE